MLKRKMLRDIRQNLSQFVTIFLMVLIGIMAYTGIQGYSFGMVEAANRFYKQNNLQDLNLVGRNFSAQDLAAVKSIPGVKNAERKLSLTATSNQEKTLLLNFIESNQISRFHVVSGQPFDAKKSGVWLDEFYAKANNYKLGQKILIKTPHQKFYKPILGIINVPDHLYDTKDASEIFSDRQDFGLAYLSARELPAEARVFNEIMVDVANHTQVAASHSYSDQVVKVKNLIEQKIPAVLAAVHIEDSLSYKTYQGEIEEGEAYVGVFSGLFLFIAMLSVITTITRLVQKQRSQIGTLKALGFRNLQISFHLVSYSFVITLLATILGLIAGYFIIGKFFIAMQMEFFEVPGGKPVMTISDYLVALITVFIVTGITLITCRQILSENPAETLRSSQPKFKNSSFKLFSTKLIKSLSFSNKWNLRDIFRNKARTIMGISGVTGCCLLITAAFGMLDSMNHFIDLQFSQLFNFNYKISLSEKLSPEQTQSLLDRYGKHSSKTLPIEIIQHGKYQSNNALVTDAKESLRFIDQSEHLIELNRDDGVYLTYKLAKENGYQVGDFIKWRIYGRKTYHKSKIVGLRRDPQNQNITMTRAYFEKLGLPYIPDSIYSNQDLSNLKTSKSITTIQNISNIKVNMNKMLSMVRSTVITLISIAVILGSVVIYNLGILSYTEKQYQFSTLKVLGFKDRQIKKIFIKQNNWIALLSVALGLPLGYLFVEWIFTTVIESNFDFHAYINPLSYCLAAFGTLAVSYFTSKFLARKIKTIDMVSSLKGNE